MNGLSFNLPLSKGKDVFVNTSEERPLQVRDWNIAHSMTFTKDEAVALIELLLEQGPQILQKLNQQGE